MDISEVLAPVRDLGGFIRQQRESAQISLRQLAKQAGVSNPYLSQVERGLRRPSAEILAQIAHGLQISVESLLTMAGILDEPGGGPEPVGVQAAIQADPVLSDRQKASLLDIYQLYRREAERASEPAGSPAVGPVASPAPARPTVSPVPGGPAVPPVPGGPAVPPAPGGPAVPPVPAGPAVSAVPPPDTAGPSARDAPTLAAVPVAVGPTTTTASTFGPHAAASHQAGPTMTPASAPRRPTRARRP
ncbi:helix-turn-helix domain-containing protein [Nakamurella deserti]|uniref:helix-turn-helix domain-containing protein n=1 Tax=Nakamurella deserti TaxID=2164074 RepID=UPI001F0C2063|nr:helix-turn-helix domain-containing protein [Nakamurella deserti]